MKKRVLTSIFLLTALAAIVIAAGLTMLWEIGLYDPVVVSIFLLAVLAATAMLAYYLSGAIVAPIEMLDLSQPEKAVAYEELRPLLNYVKQQRRQIDDQIIELKEKQREFATMTENMNEGLVVINDQGYILSINARAIQILGIKEHNRHDNKHILMAKPNSELQKLVDDGLEGYYRNSIVELDGRLYQVVTNPIRNDGLTQGIVLFLLDVTEKQQQEQLRREFTANVSHELRTPLTAISGYAEIMMHGLVSEADVQPFAEKIYKEANRLITLIADIIQLSRLDEGSAQFAWEMVDVVQMVEEVVQRLQPLAQQKEVTLSIYTEPTMVAGIRQVLQEILYNLCENAIKYNRTGGNVRISVVQANGMAVMKVVDNGIGIAPEDQPRIFERFYRADKSHSRLIGGTGLGLSIVKHGVQLHHGEIQLESTLGQGTAITVRLPMKQPE